MKGWLQAWMRRYYGVRVSVRACSSVLFLPFRWELQSLSSLFFSFERVRDGEG
jgi:hypothetical protein